MMTEAELHKRFAHHAPNSARVALHEGVRSAAMDLAVELDQLVPDGREKSLMLTHLETVMFWANAGVARS